MNKLQRYIPLILILLAMFLAFYYGIGDYLSMEKLKEHRKELLALVQQQPYTAPFTFVLIYALMTALSIPGAVFLTLFGGFLFPQPLSTLLVVTGATLGAIAIFLAARTAFGDVLERKAGPFLKRMENGFQENAASYLLFLRLVPLFPFWLVNLAPAFFNVRLSTYTWTTFLGIIPGAFVFSQAGAGLGAILDTEGPFSLATVLNIQMRIALIALGLFALIPVIVRKLRDHKNVATHHDR